MHFDQYYTAVVRRLLENHFIISATKYRTWDRDDSMNHDVLRDWTDQIRLLDLTSKIEREGSETKALQFSRSTKL